MTIESPQGRHLQVAGVLRREIQSGEFPAGSVLPSEPELAARFGVSRSLINRALALLRAEGLVRPERGRGTTVNPIPVIRRDAVSRQRRDVRETGEARGAFDGELRSLGLTPRSEVTPEQTAAPAWVAELLGVDEGAPVLARRRRMYANDVPVQLAVSYIPWEIAEGTQLAETDTGPGGAYSRLADLGYAPETFAETVRVRTPDEAEAQALGMDLDQRVLSVSRTARTAQNRVVEVNEIVLPAHQWELSYEWPAS
jgi:GntR family transcriptional regulator